jgi:hypothetical protein
LRHPSTTSIRQGRARPRISRISPCRHQSAGVSVSKHFAWSKHVNCQGHFSDENAAMARLTLSITNKKNNL